MRKAWIFLFTAAVVSLAGCVTINVYFPEAAAQKAADQFVGSVINGATPGNGSGQNGNGKDMPSSSSSSGQPPQASVRHEAAGMRLLDLVVPAAYADDTPNLKINTPEIEAIHARMRKRFESQLKSLLNKGEVGFTHDGLVAVHSESDIPLSQRSQVQATVNAENQDRRTLYQAIARANGHPGWASKIQRTFANIWIQKAHAGWYVQDASGQWHKK